MNPYYIDYSEYLARIYGDRKVQKLSVNAGFCCPNRDGTIGTGGCIYCQNTSFTPSYCFENDSVAEQLESGKKFFGKKYPNMQYIAYFQSYTNTYSSDLVRLEQLYAEALSVKDIVGLAIGTRPDMLADGVVELLADINQHTPVFVELGVETLNDNTLRLLNRGHSSEAAIDAINRLTERGLRVGAHLIAGLPGVEDEELLATIERMCRMGVDALKLHHLQVLKDTKLAQMVSAGEITLRQYTIEDYLELCCRVVERVDKRAAIERFLASAPPAMVISPRWGMKNYEFTNRLLGELAKREKDRN